MSSVELISGPSQTFFSSVTAISFAVFAASRTLDVVKRFHGKEIEYRHLKSVSMLAGLTMFAAILPLCLADSSGGFDVQLGSAIFLSASLAVFLHVVYEMLIAKLHFVFPRASRTLLIVSSFAVVAIAINVFSCSLIVYKIIVLWSFLLLCIRFYLVVGVYVMGNET